MYQVGEFLVTTWRNFGQISTWFQQGHQFVSELELRQRQLCIGCILIATLQTYCLKTWDFCWWLQWHHFHQRHQWHVWCHIVMFGIAGSATRPVGTIETTSLIAGLAKPSGWLRLSLKIYNELIWDVKTWSGRNDDDEAKWCWLGEM